MNFNVFLISLNKLFFTFEIIYIINHLTDFSLNMLTVYVNR